MGRADVRRRWLPGVGGGSASVDEPAVETGWWVNEFETALGRDLSTLIG